MITLVWELMQDDDDTYLVTERARVLGGWLVRSRGDSASLDAAAIALTFVPDTHAAWDDAQV